MKKVQRIALYLLSGILIGGGAMLPGVSGGVLAVVFGVYMPLMELFTSPIKAIKKHIFMFVPVLIGMAIGFYLSAVLLEAVFAKWELFVVCLFAGIILGTVPSLHRNAKMQGEIKTKGYLIMLLCCAFSIGMLLMVQIFAQANIQGNFWWFLFSGFVWGLSIVVPGMNSSNILIFMGLYQQMNQGIKALDFMTIIPVGIGILACALLFARLVKKMYDKYYTNMWCAVIGLVIGSTVMILPYEFVDIPQFVICAVCAVGGFIASIFLNKIQDKVEH